MTNTISYDKPIKNLIDALSATGHVTHTKYAKHSVTIHHNAGRMSHEGVLQTWQSRPASAHFDVDAYGRVAQYVDVNEYAWATGSTQGNIESISIEQCDLTLDPNWEIASTTWQEAARLAGWLFAHYVDGTPRPSSSNLFVHHHWMSTACAGPFMDRIYGDFLAHAQVAYDAFHGGRPPGPRGPVETLQQALKVTVDGKWGAGTDIAAVGMRNAARAHMGYPINIPGTFNIKAVQNIIGVNQDGVWGPITQATMTNWVKIVQGAVLGVPTDGKWGPGTDNAFMTLRSNSLNKF